MSGSDGVAPDAAEEDRELSDEDDRALLAARLPARPMVGSPAAADEASLWTLWSSHADDASCWWCCPDDEATDGDGGGTPLPPTPPPPPPNADGPCARSR
jgi:hypothetical protein